jgi:hypothetical protein
VTFYEAVKSDCFVKVLFLPSLRRRGSGEGEKFGLLAKPSIDTFSNIYTRKIFYLKKVSIIKIVNVNGMISL